MSILSKSGPLFIIVIVGRGSLANDRVLNFECGSLSSKSGPLIIVWASESLMPVSES